VIPNPQFNKRVQESKEMKVLRQLQEKYDDQILNQDEKTSLAHKTMSWKEFGKMGGRPSATAREELRGLAGHKRSNRKGHLEESRKKDFTAYQKMKIVEGINQKIDRGLYQDQGDKKFWPSEAKKLRISSERLKDIMARKSEWVLLVQKHQVSTRGKRQRKKDSKRQRASGGGRKREFQPQINQLKDWLHRERSAGPSIPREDVTKEMESLINQRAEQCLINAQLPNQHPESVKACEQEAKMSHYRTKKLESSKAYRKQYAYSLINFIGAKSYSKEQSAEIRPQEEKIRAKLTRQGI